MPGSGGSMVVKLAPVLACHTRTECESALTTLGPSSPAKQPATQHAFCQLTCVQHSLMCETHTPNLLYVGLSQHTQMSQECLWA